MSVPQVAAPAEDAADHAGDPGGPGLPPPGSLRAWVLAARPRTLVAGWAPVLTGTVFVVVHHGSWSPLRALAALVVAVAIQVGTNLVNDAADHARGADTAERLGPPRAVASGLLGSRAVMACGLACFGVAGLAGLWLASVSSWWLLVPGGLALVAGIAYTAGPKPLAYLGVGELFVFAFFGLFATVGTVLVQLPPAAWGVGWPTPAMLGVSFGLLGVAILEVNNIRDAPTDALVHKRTLAVRLGDRRARIAYRICLWGSFVFLFAGFVPRVPFLVVPLVAALLALPSARRAASMVAGGAEGRALNQVLGLTANVEVAFALGLSAAWVAARLALWGLSG